MRRQLARVGTGALVAAALIASCGGGGSENPDRAAPASATTTTTTVSSVPETTTTTTAQQPEQEAILAAVDGFWQAIRSASDPPNPDHPDLPLYLTGEQLATTVRGLSERADQAISARLPEDSVSAHEGRILSFARGHATVVDCAVDDGVLYDTSTGEVIDDDVVTRLWLLTLVTVDGTWKVSESRVQQEWEGARQCFDS